MIRHIVWWTLKEHAKGKSMAVNLSHIQAASAELHGLPSVHTIQISAKVLPSTTVPAQLVLTTTHKTMEDLEAYKIDPVHVNFAKMLEEYVTSRNCIDFSFEPSLELGNE